MCRRRQTTIILVAGSLLIAMLFSITLNRNSSAGGRNEDEPASEGSRISPAGSLVIDTTTGQPAVGSLPVNFVRSPDHTGRDGRGRYLIAVNSGYGIQFNESGNLGQQSLAVVDLNANPAPVVIQNVFFPKPQSVNVGAVFSHVADDDGSYTLYASGGFENKIWMFRFRPGDKKPITPESPGPDTQVTAPSIDVSGFATNAPTTRYNLNHAPVYPAGIALSPDGDSLFVANNLGDSLGVVSDLSGARKLGRIALRGRNGQSGGAEHFTYPYAVVALPHLPPGSRSFTNLPLLSPNKNANNDRHMNRHDPSESTYKVYVSCWNDSSVAVIDFTQKERKVSYISVGQHPTAMLWDGTRSRLYVANTGDDTVSMIDTRSDREIERINVRLAEKAQPGNSPEGLALDQSGTTLFVANAHSNSIAVVGLSATSLDNSGSFDRPAYSSRAPDDVSRVRGFIPTGQYPSTVAFVAGTLFVGNGKGTGVANSSLTVNHSGRVPNAPNGRFPAGTGRGKQGGQYSVSIVVGNISEIASPNDTELARYTHQVMRNNGLLGSPLTRLFSGASPVKHVIYVIRENRTYDQVLGDLKTSGNGARADGDENLAIFGAGQAAARPDSTAQDITPNYHALALRFGLFDRFFVNSEASPDGHNWATAAFSSDYVDKAFRWEYSKRGRGYDYEGFNRLPDYEPRRNEPSLFGSSVTTEEVTVFMQRFVPYLHGSRDIAEPETLYLWDAAARAGLNYRNYGEFIATLSQADIDAIKRNKTKAYPDISPTVSAFPTKKSLEGHFNAKTRNFDLDTPDAMTVDSYRTARSSSLTSNALISSKNPEVSFRGTSRLGDWLDEFRSFALDREAGKPDRLANLSIVRLSNDHTDGLKANRPTPQFFVADNDYALGKLVEAVSQSPYWKDTAIFVVEDDAQDGPDHVDAHRSIALVISAYNRPGLLIHDFHNTVSLIRTMEVLLGLPPMNQLDAVAPPIDIFRSEPDLRSYVAQLPNVALDNLMTPARPRDAALAYWMAQSDEQDLSHQDMADPQVFNKIIWFSVKGKAEMPPAARLPAFDAMRLGLSEQVVQIARARRRADPD